MKTINSMSVVNIGMDKLISSNLKGFLSDKLYQWVQLREISDTDDFKSMINELIYICERSWKPFATTQIGNSKGTKEVKIALDRTFNSWDLFVSKLRKENWFLVDMLEKYSYRIVFMENLEFKKIYESL